MLMNIPYDDFYKAELKNNDVKVDAFTSATLNKSRTAGMMNGNSAYHVDPNGTDVTGVTFPVKVSDLSLLKDQKQVTDSDSVTITVTNRGQTSTTEYNGKEEKIFEDILDFHVKFERIHPFQDGSGRVGRLIMFKECLKYNIVPFIIEDNLKMFYYRGLKEWNNEKGYLTDTCLIAQDKYKTYLDYFRIMY